MGETPKKLGELWKEVSSEEKAENEVSCSSPSLLQPRHSGSSQASSCAPYVDTFPCSLGESALCAGNGREGQWQGCSRAC